MPAINTNILIQFDNHVRRGERRDELSRPTVKIETKPENKSNLLYSFIVLRGKKPKIDLHFVLVDCLTKGKKMHCFTSYDREAF
jgi:hypothetical protein